MLEPGLIGCSMLYEMQWSRSRRSNGHQHIQQLEVPHLQSIQHKLSGLARFQLIAFLQTIHAPYLVALVSSMPS